MTPQPTSRGPDALHAIYEESMLVVREVHAVAARVEPADLELARVLRRASSAVLLDLGEGCYGRDVGRRACFVGAVGAARETRRALRSVDASGLAKPAVALFDRLDALVGVLRGLSR